MIIAGFGFRGEASMASLKDAYERLGGGADLLAVPHDKAGALCIRQLAAELDLKIQAIDDETLAATETPTQSDRVTKERGTGSVAEACALAAAGAEGRLLGQRHISADRMATCALAIQDATT